MSKHGSKRRVRARTPVHRPVQGLLRIEGLEDRSVPSTFYIDPALAGSADGSTVTFNAGKTGQVGGLTYASTAAFYNTDKAVHPAATYAFSDLRQAIEASELNPGADTIDVAQGAVPLDNTAVTTPVTGGKVNSVLIDQPLTLVGSGQGLTVITPTTNTEFDSGAGPAADPSTAVFLVTTNQAAGTQGALTASDFTFDGTGKQVGIGFDITSEPTVTSNAAAASGSFTRVTVQNLSFPGAGAIAIQGFGANQLTVANSTITGYDGSGVQFVSTPGMVSNSTITGPGAGSPGIVNNGIEVQGSTVTIIASRITGNAAANSSGVLVHGGADVYSGKFTPASVHLTGSEVTGNNNGIALGTAAPAASDASLLNAQNNNISGNTFGAFVDAAGSKTTNPITAPNNFWGDATGPFNATSNPGGKGNPVTDNVVFQPFLTSAAPALRTTTPFYVDPALAGSAAGSTVTFNAGKPGQVTGLRYEPTAAAYNADKVANPAATYAFSDLRQAIEASELNPGADTIDVAQGAIPLDNSAVTTPLSSGGGTVNSVLIDQPLSLVGSGQGLTVITPTTDTEFDPGTGPVADPSTAVFLVSTNQAAGTQGLLNAANFTFDGTGRQIGIGFEITSDASVTNNSAAASGALSRVTIQNLSFPGAGAIAVQANGAKQLTVDASTIKAYDGSGIIFDTTPGTVSNSVITGPAGAGAAGVANNGIDVASFSNVAIYGNTITGNTGVNSSGILVQGGNDFYTGAFSPATVSVYANTITGNNNGIALGTSTATAPDASKLDAQYNNIFGNSFGAFVDAAGSKTTNPITAPYNFWGDATGPLNAKTNPGGKGNPVTDNVVFQPFLTAITPPQDTPPQISVVPNQTVTIGTPLTVQFAVVSALYPAANLTVTATSSNPAVTVTVSGTGSQRTLTLTGTTPTTTPATITLTVTDPQGVSSSETFQVTVVNPTPPPPPAISGIPDQTVTVGTPDTVAFAVTSGTFPASSLAVTATSSNPTVTVSVSGTGSQRTLTITGTTPTTTPATITVTVTDPSNGTTTDTFQVTVVNPTPPSNTPPQITPIASQTVSTDEPLSVPFAVVDAESPASALTVTATSSDPRVTVAVSGTGSQRTLTLTSTTAGVTATITVTATDPQGLSSTQTFTATVVNPTTPTNTPPVISGVSSPQSVTAGTPLTVQFAVTDAESPATALTVTATSSNPAVTATVGGTGSQRTVTLTGTTVGASSTVTLTVTDPQGLSTSTTFTATVVAPPNTPPTISTIPDQTVSPGTSTSALPFIVLDAESPASTLKVTATSSNPTLTPTLTLGGSGSQRTIVVGAASATGGTATITVTVTDPQGASSSTTFNVTVPQPIQTGRSFAVGGGAGLAQPFYVVDQNLNASKGIVPFAPSFTGGVRVAEADVNGDGVLDVIVGSGPGQTAEVKVYDGKDLTHILIDFNPFEASFTGGVFVAGADFNGDGKAEIVVSPDLSGGPRVLIIDGAAAAAGRVSKVDDFYGIDDPNFRGGARVGTGDMNHDGTADLFVAAGFGGGPRIAIYDGKSLGQGSQVKLVADFFAFESTLRNGAFVAGGDYNGDGYADVVLGAGPGGGPRVRVLDGKTLLNNNTQIELANFYAGSSTDTGGVTVAARDLDGDGKADLITGPGAGDGSLVRVYLSTKAGPTNISLFGDFSNGIYVG